MRDATTLLQHEELSKYTAMGLVRNTTSSMSISTHVHSAKDSPSHTRISANAHKKKNYVNLDPECIWRRVNELQSVFDFHVSILKTITI